MFYNFQKINKTNYTINYVHLRYILNVVIFEVMASSQMCKVILLTCIYFFFQYFIVTCFSEFIHTLKKILN